MCKACDDSIKIMHKVQSALPGYMPFAGVKNSKFERLELCTGTVQESTEVSGEDREKGRGCRK